MNNDEAYHHPVLKEVSLERTMCYGSCPVYKVTVFGDGRVVYDGEHFVAKEGRHEWRTTKRRMTAIVKAIEKAGFFDTEFSDEGLFVTDMPSTITTVEFVDGRKKRIERYHGNFFCPGCSRQARKDYRSPSRNRGIRTSVDGPW
jgi:uncharacterized protein (AIM24 family)